jgi:hypothetical protein
MGLVGLLFASQIRQISHFWRLFGHLYLDSALRPAISPATRRGIFSRCLFLRGWWDRSPDSAEIEPITTEEKAGPDMSEAGIEHEGI